MKNSLSLGVQYQMPEAYDQDGRVNQEKRFAVSLQRYRSVGICSV